jgi:ATP-binding cassette, subfamily B, bacterial CvaB/MchF/RaxB
MSLGRSPYVLQDDRADCGAACLASIARALGADIELTTIKAIGDFPAHGSTFVDLMRAADRIGFGTRALRADIGSLGRLRLPAILHWGMFHFVVLRGFRGGRLVIWDPAVGHQELPHSEAGHWFTGVCLELWQRRSMTFAKPPARLRLLDVFLSIENPLTRVGLATAVSLLAQSGLILFPIFLQAIFHFGVHPSNAAAVALACAISLTLLGINVVAFKLKARLVGGMIRDADAVLSSFISRVVLNLSYGVFLRKSEGAIQQHFRAVRKIRTIFAGGSIDALVDLAGVVAMVGLLIVVHPALGILSAVAVAVQAVYMVASHRRQVTAATVSARLEAIESAILVENLKNIQAIKLQGLMELRHIIWQTAYLRASDLQQQLRTAELSGRNISETLLNIARYILVGWAALQLMSGAITESHLISFIVFFSLLVSLSGRLVPSVLELIEANVLMGDMSDLASERSDHMARPSSALMSRPNMTRSCTPFLRVRSLGFRHAGATAPLFGDVNLEVRAGEVVVLTGPSGSGKSTLLKVLMGLFEDHSGVVSWNGTALADLDRLALSRLCGCVMQEDQIFAGTILQNIVGFSPEPHGERLKAAMRVAEFDSVFARKGMGLHTQISSSAEMLSTGEKQRLFLARALYGAPRMLVLDELTGHLDEAIEARIFQNLRGLGISILMTAHRTSTIALADRVVELRQGAALPRALVSAASP